MKFRLIELATNSAQMNMAIDEAILNSVMLGKSDPTIRFYKWEKGAVSLGIGQDYSILKDKDVIIVKRPTGGNSVYHSPNDLTYSVIAPKDLFLGWRDAYEKICGRIINAVNLVSVLEAKLIGRNDVVLNGKKVCGNAIDYSKNNFFLQHGAIFCDSQSKNKWLELFDFPKEKLKISFLSDYLKDGVFQEDFYNVLRDSMAGLADEVYIGKLSERELFDANYLANEKYSNVNWIKGVKKGTVCAADIKND